MLEVIRYRGSKGIYSWSVAQKGFNTLDDAIKSIHICQTFQKRDYNYLVCEEGTKLERFFEKNVDKLPKVCYIKIKEEKRGKKNEK